MLIYTNLNHRIISIDTPPANVANYNEIDISDDETFMEFSNTKKLCYYYRKDDTGVSWYPAMNLDDIAVLENKQSQIDNLNTVVDMLIVESLEGE